MKPLVCVIAHPDDEAFGPAGTIAKYASERDVYILCVTSGDADPQFTHHDAKNLGPIREKELLASAKILGVKHVDFLGFKDGSLCNNLYHQVADKIRQKLQRYQPDTVMTFEPRGVSGHIDHVVVSLTTTFVVQKLPFVRTLLYYVEKKEVVDQIHDYFVYFPPGYAREEVDMISEVSAYWETRLRAMGAHVSQKDDADWIIKTLSQYPKEEYFLKIEK